MNSPKGTNGWFGSSKADHNYFLVVTALCWWMAIWSAVFPGGWRVGLVPGYKELLQSLDLSHFPVNSDVTVRFADYPSIRFLHILPSSVWAALAPLQFASRLGRFPPRLHKVLGRLMLLSCIPIICGYILMEVHNVGLPHSTFGRYSLRALCTHFTLTAVLACVTARRRNFAAHQAWVIRHIASGGWVIVQRLCVALGRLLPMFGLARFDTYQEKERGFYAMSALAVVLTYTMTEVYLLMRRQEAHKPQPHAKAA